MTQSNGNGSSRLDRLEAIMLDLASATVRHDNEFSKINQTLDRLAEQQREADERYERRFNNITNQVEFNREQINTLTASIQELRNLVADYIQGRSN
jgi:predicted  nucleic acid-binding Zn-ribbon protein